MIANVGMDIVVLCVGIGSGFVGLGLAAVMLRRARPAPRTVNVEEIVRKAPYDRLHNVLKVEPRR